MRQERSGPDESRLANEITLIERAMNGGDSAWEQLIAEFGPAIWKVIFRIVGNAHDADDVYQETWAALVILITRFDPTRGEFEAWAKKIARNKALDALRKRDRLPGVSSDPIEGIKGPEPLKATKDHVWLSMFRLCVLQALSRLTDLDDDDVLSDDDVREIYIRVRVERESLSSVHRDFNRGRKEEIEYEYVRKVLMRVDVRLAHALRADYPDLEEGLDDLPGPA